MTYSHKHVSLAMTCAVVVAAFALPMASFGKKEAAGPSGEAVFKANCAQCHPAGGNVVNPSKPLRASAKLESFPTFKAYLENPSGHMPFYKHVITDQAALHALYNYCKTLKPGKTT